METLYLHGTSPDEQDRLARMNELINADCLAAARLAGERRVLDLGSGLGQMTLEIAAALGPDARVVAVEADAEQLSGARASALGDPAAERVDFRQGRAEAPPLTPDEIGTFDLAHTRFLLEHHPDPRSVVTAMVEAVRPGGRVLLFDDDHDVLRLSPDAPRLASLWQAYARLYAQLGYDPIVGRRLVSLLHAAGAAPVRCDWVFYGACAGEERFQGLADNIVHVLLGVRERMITEGFATEEDYEQALAESEVWRAAPDAALWYAISFAEGRKPGG